MASSSSMIFTETTPFGVDNTTAEVTLNISDEEKRRYLSHLDDTMFPKMIPAVVYLAILMFLGIFGNILVLIVYLKKFKPSPTRVFVVCLAVFDLMTCIISLPGEILDMRYTHTFNYPHLCRILRFNNTFSVVSSGFTLIAVAIDRYRKICRPLNKQITIRVARIMVGIAVSVSLVLTIPTVIVNGKTTVLTDREGITGFDCSFDDMWSDTLFPLVYTGVLFLVFFGSLSVLVIVYILIGRTVFIHRKFKFRPASDNKNQSPQNSTSETELSSGDGKERNGKRYLLGNGKSSDQGKGTRIAWISPRKTTPPSVTGSKLKVGVDGPSETSRTNLNDDPVKPKTAIFTRGTEQPSNGVRLTKFVKFNGKGKNSAPKPEERSGPKASKTTLMLFIITAVFIISFLPHLILMITRGFKSDFLESLHGGGIIVYNVFLRSYFMNSAANCIVYSFCNVKFRNECKKLLVPCLSLRKK
ncbi:orexin receptor type 2-like [Haliotis rubra]|uniref:orexin receptor type 2-like n=1 Tax=Haliotis rubra TaxID=36100 RepID=UPI001EE4EC81|nr:orexin receptor type 2-like [Haliotis rubra]